MLEPVALILGISLTGDDLLAGLRWLHDRAPVRTETWLGERSGRDGQGALVALQTFLDSQSVQPSELAGVCFSAGPGSYTRVRIACAIAQGLAFSQGIRVAPVDDLAIAARVARAKAAAAGIVSAAGDCRVVVLSDARMGECFAACFVGNGPTLNALEPARLIPIDDVAGWVRAIAEPRVAMLFTGDALVRQHARLQAAGVPGAIGQSVALDPALAMQALLDLAVPGPWVPAAEAAPRYLRDKVALDIDEQSHLRASRLQAGGSVPSSPSG